MLVRDLMTIDVVTVTTDVSLKEVARLMVDRQISGVPVVGPSNAIVGIITEADFLIRDAGTKRRLLGALFDGNAPLVTDTVGEAMTPHPVVIYAEASLAEAGRSMVTHGVKRLPVVDVDGHVVGIVSRSDIVRAFARPDDVIEDEIRHDILRRVLLFDPDLVRVAVEDGVVGLDGALPEKADVRLFEELVRRVDGVVRLESKLRWDTDEAAGSDYY